MSQELWSSVDDYICGVLAPDDAALRATQVASAAAGLPPISVTANQGKFLMLLARSIKARNILELGTLGGYSTIWLARGLDGGSGGVVSVELDPHHAEVAKANIAHAGFADRVNIRVGRALDILSMLAAEKREPFDLVFIDADKAAAPDYFEWAMQLTRVGGLIIIDNVVRSGAVIDAATEDPGARGIRRLNELMAAEPRVIATAIQTVGSKGHDGFAIAMVTSA